MTKPKATATTKTATKKIRIVRADKLTMKNINDNLQDVKISTKSGFRDKDNDVTMTVTSSDETQALREKKAETDAVIKSVKILTDYKTTVDHIKRSVLIDLVNESPMSDDGKKKWVDVVNGAFTTTGKKRSEFLAQVNRCLCSAYKVAIEDVVAKRVKDAKKAA